MLRAALQGLASGTGCAPALQGPVLVRSVVVACQHSMPEMAVKGGIPRVPG